MAQLLHRSDTVPVGILTVSAVQMHTPHAPRTEVAEQSWDGRRVHKLRDHLAHGRQVVHQTAGLPVGGVHRAQEAPGLRQQPAHCGGPHLGEVGASVHAAEMREVADEVQLVCHDTKSRVLQEAKTLIKQKSFKNRLHL